MKKIALIGFNIFAPGGTSQSNYNMIEEFHEAGYFTSFYNFRPFSKRDVRKLKEEHPYASSTKFFQFQNLDEIDDPDYIFLTREEFFCLAPYLRKISTAKVIGEIHAPLPMVNEEDLGRYLPYMSFVRVATDSVKKQIEAKYDFHRVYAQTVSLKHISTVELPYSTKMIDDDGFVNFAVRARFDYVKDIPYSIRLMDYLINFKGNSNYRFYITGYGPAKSLYRNLIKYYNLEENILLNEDTPANHIYLSTSFMETFGYSIVEEFSEGHPVALYSGDDGVLKENFGSFNDCMWISKNIAKDATGLVKFVNSGHSVKDYQHNLELIKNIKSGYVSKFEVNTAGDNLAEQDDSDELTLESTLAVVAKKMRQDGMRKFRKFYYKIKKVPGIGSLVSQEWIREPAMNILRAMTGSVKAPDEPEGKLSPHKYFIESFHGSNFSGDPKYFALDIKKRDPQAEIYVSSRNQLVDMEVGNYGLTPVRTGSLKYIEQFQKCKYIFMNGNTLDKAGKREGQIFVETWHGFPMKKMVNDLEDEKQREIESTAFAPRMQKWDYLTTSSEYNTELLESAFKLEDNKGLNILSNGTPKNEYLLAHDGDEAEKARIFEKYFNRPYNKDEHFVLFCPTWRKGNRGEVSELDLTSVVKGLPDNYELIVKLHPNEGGMRKHYSDLDPRIYCFYNETVDIQELYLLSDVLISDYSSAIFDYAMLDKKTIVMQEDEDDYAKKIGWYFDSEKECGLEGKKYTESELIDAIMQPDSDREYNRLIKERLMTNEHIGATEDALNKIVGRGSNNY